MYKIIVFSVLSFFVFNSCSSDDAPDVSSIKVDLTLKRFERDFFQIDTNNTSDELTRLYQEYGFFLNDFLYNIIGLPPQSDSSLGIVNAFIRDYRPMFQASEDKFSDMNNIEQDIELGLKYVHYYFPEYELPATIITFIGPVEGYANVLTQNGLAVGLQLYLGKDFYVYQSSYVSEIYPAYQQRRFEPEYILVNCLKNIVQDLYPESNSNMSQPLIYQMIEAGKRLYLLTHFLPDTHDTLLTGYTKQQLEGSMNNESMIWNALVQNDLIFSTDPLITREYMQDGPSTQLLGPASPGFIGQFIGGQIVKKWMSQNEARSLQELINTSTKQIYEEAKYKPG